MEKHQNMMKSFITNPGFEHLGQNILMHLNKKTSLAVRLVNHSTKDFVDNPIFWLKKLNYKNSGSLELHIAWSTLIQKIKENNLDLAQNVALNLIKLIDSDDLNADEDIRLDHDGYRYFFPLNVFSLFGDFPLVKFIIENNMVDCLSRNCELQFSKELTPIHLAAISGHTEIARALIGCVDNPNAPDNNGMTPIHWAATIGHHDIVKALIECNGNLNSPDNFGCTPIYFAVWNGHTEIVKTLIGCTDNSNASDNHGQTPIYIAAMNGHTEIVKALIGCTDNPNAPNNDGWTPIHYAARDGHNEIIKALISCTDNPNSSDNHGHTPIYFATINGHLETVQIMIGYTDNPNAPNNYGMTPYKLAELFKHVEIMRILEPYVIK